MREQLVAERERMRLDMEREAMCQEQQASMRAIELEKEASMRAMELEKEASMRAIELEKEVGATPDPCPGRDSAHDPSPPSRSLRIRREDLRMRTPSPQSPSSRLTSSASFDHQCQQQYPQSLTQAAQHYARAHARALHPPLGSTDSSPRSPISKAGAGFEGDRLDASISALRAAMDAPQQAHSLSHSPVFHPRSTRERSRVKISPGTEARHM